MKSIRIISAGEDIGSVDIQKGELQFSIKDKNMDMKIRDLAEKEFFYLKDEEIPGGVKTVKVVASPGTEEHLRVLLFELRKIGLEGRFYSQED